MIGAGSSRKFRCIAWLPSEAASRRNGRLKAVTASVFRLEMNGLLAGNPLQGCASERPPELTIWQTLAYHGAFVSLS